LANYLDTYLHPQHAEYEIIYPQKGELAIRNSSVLQIRRIRLPDTILGMAKIEVIFDGKMQIKSLESRGASR